MKVERRKRKGPVVVGATALFVVAAGFAVGIMLTRLVAGSTEADEQAQEDELLEDDGAN